ncbi:exodeoxyribonuclease V subunit alpha [Vibrio mangrovi]|uniref:RecBCD enzyme subunit RecD n=1 Tax=Vibrio mangrovi TaxID=474394 RepID=A0A1Y6IRK3_9VIBR|nr:exodeoxyribonuclease V subunit alpha [Vibrio mangrovi]MDW6001674.1 exodeoxyribonuclease V subunit alpha [Vibrio mangrovi]SMS00299.1 RecBCD enzyme subunit RecD [Vibrio mangrovi]
MTVLAQSLSSLSEKRVIRPLDQQFARFISRQCPQDQDAVAWLAALVSYELGRGHICVPLVGQDGHVQHSLLLFGHAVADIHPVRSSIENLDWLTVIRHCPLIGEPGSYLPLIFDGERLYLQRYWHYESQLAFRLQALSSPVPIDTEQTEHLFQTLNQLFPRPYDALFQALQQVSSLGEKQRLVCEHLDIVRESELDWPAIDELLHQVSADSDLSALDVLVPESVCLNWQKVAAAIALSRRFAVISGGPGTGKTTTVAKLLAALMKQSSATAQQPVIKLVAPTGKAAARLTESIGQAVERLSVSPEMKAQIPTQASTLHRLLGAIPNSAEFRHHQGNPLHVDLLVVDEASMIDLPMMYKLLTALPEHARLVLLGDKDQLASVEAGAVLGDICSFQSAGYSRAQIIQLERLTGYRFDVLPSHAEVPSLADSLCLLQKSYRFHSRSGIGQLAKAVNSGDISQLLQVCQQTHHDVQIHALDSDSYHQMLQTLVSEYAGYLDAIARYTSEPDEMSPEKKAEYVLHLFHRCRLLCAVREGDFGVTGVNQRIERALSRHQLIRKDDEQWYEGRPVMISRNDHHLGLYNGDIGICMRDPQDERLKVYFEQFDGKVRGFLPSRIPEHETAYAMTIHKSQGSEFDFTLLLLPPDHTPILTRELVYTGITRARKRLALFTSQKILQAAVRVKTQRVSGLRQKMEV